MIWSFLEEPLVDHSILTLVISKKAFGRPSRRSVIERFRAKGLQVDPEELDVSIPLAYVLHDVGKALSWYQVRLERWMRERQQRVRERRPGFPYHEVISAKVINDVFRILGVTSSSELRLLMATSVLLHHQAMRDLESYLGGMSKVSNEVAEIIEHKPRIRPSDKTDIQILSLKTSQLIGRLDAKKMERSLLDASENLSLEGLRGLLETIVERMENRPRVFALLPLLLVPLQMSDNVAASVLRPNASPLSRLSMETLRLIDAKRKLTERLRSRKV